MTLNLFLIRHGLIKANVTRVWHGSTDSPLLWRGRRQARRLGKYLSRTHPTIDAVYASPLIRCLRTAEIACAYTALEIETLPDLREMSVGEWENKSFKWLQEEHNFMRKLTVDPDHAAPGGESLRSVATRSRAAIEHIHRRHPSGCVIAVSHGIALAALLADLLHEDVGRWQDYQFSNCSLTHLQFDPEPTLLTLNQTFHL